MENTIFEILNRVEQGQLSLGEAAEALGLHRSTVWRKLVRVRRAGAAGLDHQLRGRPSNRRLPETIRAQAIALCRGWLAREALAVTALRRRLAEHAIAVSYPTLTRWLQSEALIAAPERRERVAGRLVLVRREVGRIVIGDEATGMELATADGVDLEAVKRALHGLLARHGLPTKVGLSEHLLTPKEKRAMKQLGDRLGVAIVTSDQPLRPVAAADRSAFVPLIGDRWAALLSDSDRDRSQSARTSDRSAFASARSAC